MRPEVLFIEPRSSKNETGSGQDTTFKRMTAIEYTHTLVRTS